MGSLLLDVAIKGTLVLLATGALSSAVPLVGPPPSANARAAGVLPEATPRPGEVAARSVGSSAGSKLAVPPDPSGGKSNDR